MDDLIAFLRARLDEDERLARLSDTPTRWTAVRGEFGPKIETGVTGGEWSRECSPEVWRCDDPQDGCMSDAGVWMAEGQHIARHDPARVLADVAAKRFIIDTLRSYEPDDEWASETDMGKRHNNAAGALRRVAAVYADHPDYNEAWRP